jgi:hypothetical protein
MLGCLPKNPNPISEKSDSFPDELDITIKGVDRYRQAMHSMQINFNIQDARILPEHVLEKEGFKECCIYQDAYVADEKNLQQWLASHVNKLEASNG